MTRDDQAPAGAATRVRVDKWLWAARFYRSRALACEAIESGQVRVDGERVKPSRGVKAGDRVTVRKGGMAWEVEVAALAELGRAGDEVDCPAFGVASP